MFAAVIEPPVTAVAAALVPPPPLFSGITPLGFMFYPTYRLAVVGIIAVALSALFVVLYRTRIGMIVRAGIEDSTMVDMLGINVYRVFMIVFGIVFGTVSWFQSFSTGHAASTGTVILAALPIILGVQLVLSFLAFDIGNVPLLPLCRLSSLRPPTQDGNVER